MTTDCSEAADAINRDGFAVVRTSFDEGRLRTLRSALEAALVQEDSWHDTQNRVDGAMVLVCPLYSTLFAEVLVEPTLHELISQLLGDTAIVYAYTSSSMPPGEGNYSVRIHNDSPHRFGVTPMNIGVTLALTDFDTSNGATFMMPGSHLSALQPDPADFLASAARFEAPAGSALVFDARLWHSGGLNTTSSWRHAITMNFCRSWMKQRLDLPRLLGEGYRNLISGEAAQRLGYLSQVPASYMEYYQPPHRRLHRGV